MNLPELPKQHKKKEADASVHFRHWIEERKLQTCSIEMKQSDGKDSMPFSEVGHEQVAYALSINGPKGALVRVQGLKGEPDYIWMRNEPAYICVKYPKGFVMIGIIAWVTEKKTSKRKSLLFDRACEIGELITF